MRSAGAAEHRTGEHPAKRTLAGAWHRATLAVLGDGLCELATPGRCRAAAAKGAQARFAEISARSAARSVSGLVQPGRKRSAQRDLARRPIRHGLVGGCWGAKGTAAGWASADPQEGKRSAQRRRRAGVSDGSPKGRDRKARCAARQRGPGLPEDARRLVDPAWLQECSLHARTDRRRRNHAHDHEKATRRGQNRGSSPADQFYSLAFWSPAGARMSLTLLSALLRPNPMRVRLTGSSQSY